MTKESPINHNIKSSQIILIDQDGNKMGIKSKSEALKSAFDQELDLVQVAINGNIPICKIMDWGKAKYKQEKTDKHNHRHLDVKETRLQVETQQRDVDIKMKKVLGWIVKGHKVKITVRAGGRKDNTSQRMKLAESKIESMISGDDKPFVASDIKRGERDAFVILSPILEHQDK